MKTVFLLFDSLNRLMLEPYGCTILETPNFRRLADGGATYHTRYNSFEFIRGQESDPWKVLLDSPIERIQEKYHHSHNDINSKQNLYHYMINREFIKEEADFPSVQCLEAGFNFLDTNRKADNWFLQIETFTPMSRSSRLNGSVSPLRQTTTDRFSIGHATSASPNRRMKSTSCVQIISPF